MRLSIFLFPCAILLCSACNNVQSEELAVLELDTLVVSEPSLVYHADEVDPDNTSAFFSLINREEFSSASTGIADVIQSISGLQIRQIGGIGSYSSASLRGSSARQVLVFLDGMLLNTAAGAAIDLNSISLSDIEAIEVYRGFTPFEFSAASIGGAINLRTRDNNEEIDSQIKASAGSFNTSRLSALLRSNSGSKHHLLSIDHLDTKNNFEFVNDNGTEYNRQDDVVEKRNNSQLEQSSALLKSGLQFNGSDRLDLSLSAFRKQQGFPSWNNRPDTRTSFLTNKGSGQLKYQSAAENSTDARWSLGSAYRLEQETYDDRESQLGLDRQHNEYTTRSRDLDWIYKVNLNAHQLGLQANGRYETFQNRDLLSSLATLRHTRSTLGLAAQDTFQATDKQWMATSTLRYHFRRDSTQSTSRTKTRALHNRSVTGQIGAKLALAPQWKFKTNAGRYERPPTFFELFGDRGLFLGNEDLRTEQSNNLDFGFHYTNKRHFLFNQALSWELSLFQNRLKDAIVMVYDSRGIGHARNVSRANISGAETTLQINLSKNLSGSVNYTYQKAVNKQTQEFSHNKLLPGRYVKAASTRLDYQWDNMNWFLLYLYESGTYYDTANLLPAADKNILNGGVKLTSGAFGFELGINNMSNSTYEDFNGHPQPGRSWLFSTYYTFQ